LLTLVQPAESSAEAWGVSPGAPPPPLAAAARGRQLVRKSLEPGTLTFDQTHFADSQAAWLARLQVAATQLLESIVEAAQPAVVAQLVELSNGHTFTAQLAPFHMQPTTCEHVVCDTPPHVSGAQLGVIAAFQAHPEEAQVTESVIFMQAGNAQVAVV